jgi:hypothetical protein
MVERIILFKLTDPSARHELASLTRSSLYDLDGLEELSVGLPADPASEKSWDFSLILRFPSLAVQNAALESGAFKELMERKLAGRCAVIKGWSFERAV